MQRRQTHDDTEESSAGFGPTSAQAREEQVTDAVLPAAEGSIVVGHDGSRGASLALETGLALAEALKASLVIVRCWSIETAPPASHEEFGYVSSFAEISEAVDHALRDDCRSLVESHPDVNVSYRAPLGQPAEMLIAVATHARMLVVGSRGRGGFASLLLGSVSEQCVHHADCPVLVVRADGGWSPGAAH
jgi:nucleotide-binding universal stress UspA family protein